MPFQESYELEVLKGDFSPNIICLSEHWLTSLEINVLNLTNYNLISSYSRILYKHDGVCIFSKNHINAKTFKFNNCKEEYFKCAILTVELLSLFIYHCCSVQNTRE